jgi:crossover junction endodeoxyribonuclease RuvC
MRILGVDPGTATTGIGIIEGDRKKGYKCLHYTCILTPANSPIDQRIKTIYTELNKFIVDYKPEILAVEELFFNNNPKTVMSVGRVGGVIILASALNNLVLKEYTPLEVKMAIAGYGRAEKIQVQKMVAMTLKLKEIPKPDDAADALAIALTAGISL